MKRAPLRRKTPLKSARKPMRKKRLARGRPSTKEPDARRSQNHKDWIAKQPCCLIGMIPRETEPFGDGGRICHPGPMHVCQGDVVAAHIRIGTRGGTGYRPNDGYTLPMCFVAHGEEHKGARTFARRWGFDPKTKAIEYANRSPYRSELGDL